MIELSIIKNNIMIAYKSRVEMYLGCYGLIKNIDDSGNFYDVFSRHSYILNFLNQEVIEVVDEIDLIMEFGKCFLGNDDAYKIINSYLNRISVIDNFLCLSLRDVINTSIFINSDKYDSKSDDTSDVFLLEKDNNSCKYKELWEEVNSSSRTNYKEFVKIEKSLLK